MAIQAARELTFALRNPAPAAPFARIDHKQHEALARLANIVKEIAAPEPCKEREIQTMPSTQAPLAPMLHAEAPVSIPSLLTQHRSSPPRVNTLAPRLNQATLGTATPTTPNSHRRLSCNIKTPTSTPPFDLYRQQRQKARPTPNKTSSPVPQRVVTYMGDTTRHLLADLQAETGRYYNTRSRAQQYTAKVVTRVAPPCDAAIEAEYDMHMANEIKHSVTGETLNLRKLLQNPDTQTDWKKGSYNEYSRLFQGHKGGVKALTHIFSFHTVPSLRDAFRRM
jgi:hypothetical protein